MNTGNDTLKAIGQQSYLSYFYRYDLVEPCPLLVKGLIEFSLSLLCSSEGSEKVIISFSMLNANSRSFTYSLTKMQPQAGASKQRIFMPCRIFTLLMRLRTYLCLR